MNKEIKIEKRQHIRVNFENPIIIYQISKSQTGNIFMVDRRKIFGKSKDIGVGGMKAELPNASSLSKFLKLNFELDKDSPLEIYTERIWGNGNFCGLRFIQQNEDFRKLIGAYADHK